MNLFSLYVIFLLSRDHFFVFPLFYTLFMSQSYHHSRHPPSIYKVPLLELPSSSPTAKSTSTDENVFVVQHELLTLLYDRSTDTSPSVIRPLPRPRFPSWTNGTEVKLLFKVVRTCGVRVEQFRKSTLIVRDRR